jgi:hypothetical protein
VRSCVLARGREVTAYSGRGPTPRRAHRWASLMVSRIFLRVHQARAVAEVGVMGTAVIGARWLLTVWASVILVPIGSWKVLASPA